MLSFVWEWDLCYKRNVLDKMEKCVVEIKIWMLINMLKLNDDKTELFVFVSQVDNFKWLNVNIGYASVQAS